MISLLSINQLWVKCCFANDFVFRKIPEAHDKYTLVVVHYVKIVGLKLSALKHHVRHRPCHDRYKRWNGSEALFRTCAMYAFCPSFSVAKLLGVVFFLY